MGDHQTGSIRPFLGPAPPAFGIGVWLQLGLRAFHPVGPLAGGTPQLVVFRFRPGQLAVSSAQPAALVAEMVDHSPPFSALVVKMSQATAQFSGVFRSL